MGSMDYTQNGPKKGECHTIPYLSCTQSTIQKANAVPKGYATSGPCQSRPSAEDDRRNKKIILTEKGNRFAGGLLDELYRIESSVIQKIGPADMEEILRGNRLFYEYFQEEID